MKKDAAKLLNRSWKIPIAVFTLDIALQIKIFEKSWGYAKDVYAWFVDFEKPYDRVLGEKLWWVLREYSAKSRVLLAVKSFYSCAEVDCPRRRRSVTIAVGVGLRQGAVTTPLRSLYELDRQSQPSGRWCRWWRLQNQPFVCLLKIWRCLHPLNGVLKHALDGFLLRSTKREWKSALKRQGYDVSTETQVSVCRK